MEEVIFRLASILSRKRYVIYAGTDRGSEALQAMSAAFLAKGRDVELPRSFVSSFAWKAGSRDATSVATGRLPRFAILKAL